MKQDPRVCVLLLACALLGPAGPVGRAAAQTTRLVSIATDGTQGNGDCGALGISGDGRYVAFASDATNLVPGDTNDRRDIFLRDTLTGTTTRVSVATSGAQGDGSSDNPGISADGRYVVFDSGAKTLLSGATPGAWQVYLRDTVAGTTSLVSVASDGTPANYTSEHPAISADGRYVAFESDATNLVPGNTGGYKQVYVRDRVAGTTVRVSAAPDGTPGNGISEMPAISADGHTVAFQSYAYNLMPGVADPIQVYARDLTTGGMTLVSARPDGTPTMGYAGEPSVCADGSRVAFDSVANNYEPGTNTYIDAFVRDMGTGTTRFVSVASDGTHGNIDSGYPSISADGRYIAFASNSSNLAAGATSGVNILLRDTVAGTTRFIGLQNDFGQWNSGNVYLAISADGRYIAFQSYASSLVPGDTNGKSDIFVCGPLPAASKPYTVSDVVSAVQVAGGLAATADVAPLNVETSDASAGRVDLRDALRLARKVAGLDPNP